MAAFSHGKPFTPSCADNIFLLVLECYISLIGLHIYLLNHEFLTKVVEKRWPHDVEKMNKLSIIEEGYEKKVLYKEKKQ